MKNKAKCAKCLFWTGIIIVVGTHLYMLVAGLPSNQIIPHSILNLVAAGLLLYVGWDKYKP